MRAINISKTEDGNVIVKIAKEFYERQAVFAAAHKLTEKFIVMIKPIEDSTVGVYVEPKMNAKIDQRGIDDAINEFCNDLLDEQVRIDLEKRYGSLREIIVKQAFSPLTLAELSDHVKKINK